MAFALRVEDNLNLRESRVAAELATGDPLGLVLTRDLLAVEAAAETDMLTSILLLDGNLLRHGAAPNLPADYCAAIDGSQIGPGQGSCGTAAFLGRPVYVTDIDTDPLWADYRELALAYGLRACWSTPIFDDRAAVIGTFAIYHRTPRAPVPDEVKAIEAVTGHVARAIMLAGPGPDVGSAAGNQAPRRPVLKVVTGDRARPDQGLELVFPGPVGESPIAAPDPGAHSRRDLLVDIARRFDAIARSIEIAIDALAAWDPDGPEIKRLERANRATREGAALVRDILLGGKNES